jgi:CDP-2,3-bis-(O-geranylgeranyl)-sn-glycerol synthase
MNYMRESEIFMRKVKDDPNLNPEDLKKERMFTLLIGALLLIYLTVWAITYTLLDALTIMGLIFFILVPSFAANGMMVIAGKIKGIKRYPIDGGRKFKDGTRILGEGKTWNGFIGGWLSGFLISAVICWWFFQMIASATNYDILAYVTKDYIDTFIAAGVNFNTYLLSQLFIALGSPIGDMIGSFFKRRRKKNRGDVFLFWDQNDFAIISGIIALIWFPLHWYFWIFLLLITPIMTALANLIGYYIGKKDVPW